MNSRVDKTKLRKMQWDRKWKTLFLIHYLVIYAVPYLKKSKLSKGNIIDSKILPAIVSNLKETNAYSGLVKRICN